MKVVIISGGSGNDTLIKGLTKYISSGLDIKVIVNAYDNGKSTGICRAITNTLGVSDIRKNHSRMYESINAGGGDSLNVNLLEFYNGRFNFEKGRELKQVLKLLKKWKLTEYNKYVKNFFKHETVSNYEFKDFSVSNIVYSQMYEEIGYELTNKHFCDKLGIDDFVVLNSFDNLFIKAQTESGHVIQDEGETVFWNNKNDKIIKTLYDVRTHNGLNERAINLVMDADLIIISTGTFWSSIQPTIEYLDFYKFINQSKAKKIWALNNEEDGDSFGVSNLELIDFMAETGLDLSQFDILINKDARQSMKMTNDKYNFVEKSMGNSKGKHDGIKYAKSILQVYFGVNDLSNYDKVLFDFDDTIWSRSFDKRLIEYSIQNTKIINDSLAKKAVIISGNSYSSIYKKLSSHYGESLKNWNVDIWADANTTLFKHNKATEVIKSLVLTKSADTVINQLSNQYGLQAQVVGNPAVNYKFKPLSNLERKLLVDLVNFKYKGQFKASMTGKTTVDILHANNTKEVVYDYCKYDKLRTLYIGDELENGNDSAIYKRCTSAVQVNDVVDTNIVLKLLLGDK